MSSRERSKILYIDAVFREPYRLFFPLAIVMGIVGISHWIFYACGWIEHYSGFFHSTIQIFTYMHCFILGFLLTAMPRFSASSPATKTEVLSFLFLIIGISIFLSLQEWVAAELLYLLSLLGLVRFALVRITRRKKQDGANPPPKELVWIPFAVLHGIIGTSLMILGQLKILPSWSIFMGKPMMEQGFLLSVVIGVGGFLAPRLMGTYQQAATEEQLCDVKTRPMITDKNKIYFNLAGGIILFISFVLQGWQWEQAGYLLRALVMTVVFLSTGSLVASPKAKDLYVRLVWISVWMVALGFWGAGLWPVYRIAMLHIAFIGGFSLMTFAVATMVILSHAGEGERLHQPLWVLWVVALGVSLALFKRAAVVMFPDAYFKFLGMSAAVWCSTALIWISFLLPQILKIPSSDEFEKMHETAKQRLKPHSPR